MLMKSKCIRYVSSVRQVLWDLMHNFKCILKMAKKENISNICTHYFIISLKIDIPAFTKKNIKKSWKFKKNMQRMCKKYEQN